MTRDAKQDALQAKEAFQKGLDDAGRVHSVRISYASADQKHARLIMEVHADGLPPIEIPFFCKLTGTWLHEMTTQGSRYAVRIKKGALKGE